MKCRREAGRAVEDQSPPSRGAWIEIGRLRQQESQVVSPPSRGAWIEISSHNAHLLYVSVAPPLAGGVD